jgi:hypothetical protein
MSVCDEGWGPEEDDGWEHRCPCLDSFCDREEAEWYCTLGYFMRHSQWDRGMKILQDFRPATCPHAAALKAVVANQDMVLEAKRATLTHE